MVQELSTVDMTAKKQPIRKEEDQTDLKENSPIHQTPRMMRYWTCWSDQQDTTQTKTTKTGGEKIKINKKGLNEVKFDRGVEVTKKRKISQLVKFDEHIGKDETIGS